MSDVTQILNAIEDVELQHRVAKLLRASDAPDSDRPANDVEVTMDSQAAGRSGLLPDGLQESQATTDHRREAAAGVVIGGRYTLQEKIGEGGMGDVWVA